MRPIKASRFDTLDPDAAKSGNRYTNANRDRVLGGADRTGRHFDEDTEVARDEGSAASEDHEAD